MPNENRVIRDRNPTAGYATSRNAWSTVREMGQLATGEATDMVFGDNQMSL